MPPYFVYAAVLRFPIVGRRFGDPVFASQIRRLRAGLVLAQNRDDLRLFRQPLHRANKAQMKNGFYSLMVDKRGSGQMVTDEDFQKVWIAKVSSADPATQSFVEARIK